MKNSFVGTLTIGATLGILAGCDTPPVFNFLSNNTATGSVQVNVDKGAADKIADALNGKTATGQSDPATGSSGLSKEQEAKLDKLIDIASQSQQATPTVIVATTTIIVEPATISETPIPPLNLASFQAKDLQEFTGKGRGFGSAFGASDDIIVSPVVISIDNASKSLVLVAEYLGQRRAFWLEEFEESGISVQTWNALTVPLSYSEYADAAKFYLSLNATSSLPVIYDTINRKFSGYLFGALESIRFPGGWGRPPITPEQAAFMIAKGNEVVIASVGWRDPLYYIELNDVTQNKEWKRTDVNKSFRGVSKEILFAKWFYFLTQDSDNTLLGRASEREVRKYVH